MAFLAIGEVERTDGQLRMAFLADALPGRAKLALYTVIDLVYLGLTGHLIVIAWRTIGRTARSESVTLPWPDAFMYTATFVAFLLIFHRVARRILARFTAARTDPEARP
ncbi:MAG: TRAP transporter small permease subunit [Paracoccaceae bacterium]